MKQIPLTKGKFALVDDEDYDSLMQWNWCLWKKYAGRLGGIKMHRVINKTPEGMQTDHINGDCLDNRKSNLRTVTVSQNHMNRKKKPATSSQYKGVSWRPNGGSWEAHIRKDSVGVYLGKYKKEEDAALAYNNAALQLFGEHARINEIVARA